MAHTRLILAAPSDRMRSNGYKLKQVPSQHEEEVPGYMLKTKVFHILLPCSEMRNTSYISSSEDFLFISSHSSEMRAKLRSPTATSSCHFCFFKQKSVYVKNQVTQKRVGSMRLQWFASVWSITQVCLLLLRQGKPRQWNLDNYSAFPEWILIFALLNYLWSALILLRVEVLDTYFPWRHSNLNQILPWFPKDQCLVAE